jgi:chitodextrinase
MQITGNAVVNVQKIAGFLNKLYNKTAKVNIGLMGDSTQAYQGHGWDSGVVLGLRRLGCTRHGTGLFGPDGGVAFGHGCEMTTVTGSATPNLTSSNGFTASMPSEWRPYLSNWGSDAPIDYPTGTDTRQYLGALKPYTVTSAYDAGRGSAPGFRIDGKNQAFTGRPFESLTSAINFQHWYLKTSNLTGGQAATRVRRESDNNGVQVVHINNLNMTGSNSAGATFSFTIGLTTTSGITFSNIATTLKTRIDSALTGAFGSSILSNSFIINQFADEVVRFKSGEFWYQLNTGSTDYNLIRLNLGGLTARFSDQYLSGLTSETYRMLASTGSSFPILISGTINSAGQSLNVNGPAHLARVEYPIEASASRDYPVGLLSQNGTTGPFCNMFSAASISGATQGFSSTTIMYIGGKGARTHAVSLKNQTNEFLGSLFQAMAEHAGYTSASSAPLLLRIVGGINDTNEGSFGSTGPSGGLACNTREGLRDNWQAIINKVDSVYSAYGWSTNNLYWLITPSTPTEASNANLAYAQLAALDVSNNNPRTAAVNLFTINGGITSDINGLASINTDDSIDVFHLTYSGYQAYSYTEWASLQSAYNASLNVAPTARINFSPSPVFADVYGNRADVVVSGLSSTDDGSIGLYQWSYGLSSATGPTASIQLPVGSNAVNLLVTDNQGATGATSINITVGANRGPTASFSANPGTTIVAGQGITFTSTSTDTAPGTISTYAWTTSTGLTANTPTARFVFGATGSPTVTLLVSDNAGATSSVTQTITVGASGGPNLAPVAAVSLVSPTNPAYDHNGNGSEVFVVSGSGSYDPESGALTYLWSNGATGVTTSYTVPIGATTVALTVADPQGATGGATMQLSVLANPTPSVTITVTPSTTVTDTDGNGVETLLFSGAGSTDASGIASYAWTVNNGYSATGITTQFTLTAGSSYLVSLLVTDIVGATGSATQTVTVNNKSRGPGSVAGGNSVWFAGKLYTQDQYIQILQAFYPNLIR